MKFTEHLSSAVTQIGDFITQAKQNESGLLSVLNDLLGPVPKPGAPSKLQQRAAAVGMEDLIRLWQTQDDAPAATEEEIRQFFTQAELDNVSNETGLSDQATLSMLQTLLPTCVRRRALHQPFTPTEAAGESKEPHPGTSDA